MRDHTLRLTALAVSATIGVAGAAGVVAFRDHSSHGALLLAAAAKPHQASAAATASSTSPVDEMSVFSENQSPTDVLPDPLDQAAQKLVTDTSGIELTLLPGDLQTSNSRRLFTAMGNESVSLYAFPTSKRQVCYVTTADSAGCIESFENDPGSVAWEINDTSPSTGTHPMLYGIVPDRVTGISVQTGATSVTVDIQRNAFFYESPDANTWPTAIVATYSDGSTDKVDLPPPPPELSSRSESDH